MDLLFLGGAVYMWKIDSQLQAFPEKLDSKKIGRIAAFSFMMCFFTLLIVNQNMTYFEKYQDVWDVMATVKNTDIDAFTEADTLQELYGVESGVVYQKAVAKRMVTQDEISEKLQAIGGLENASTQYVSAADPNFHDRCSVSYLAENGQTIILRNAGQEDASVEIPVLAYARQAPVLCFACSHRYWKYFHEYIRICASKKKVLGSSLIDSLRDDTTI